MLFRSLLFWLALALPGFAQGLPSAQSDTISDFAGIFSAQDMARISATLREKRKETGVHVTVVTMDTIANYGGDGQRIEDYAKALFNQWGVGAEARNDGILMLVALEDRETRIALGAGYEAVWDNAGQRVIDRDMLPAFRDDRYVEGIEAGVLGTYNTIVGPHRAGQPAPEASDDGTDYLGLAIFGSVIGFVAFLLLRKPVGDFLQRFRHCPNCGARALQRTRRVLTAVTTELDGLAEVRTACHACHHEMVETHTLTRNSGESDSGGFGGGSSSGGGATGRW